MFMSRLLSLLLIGLSVPTFAQTLQVLHAFSETNDGLYPQGGLIRDQGGNLYGTTFEGGIGTDYGTVFKIDVLQNLIILHTFNYSDGASPFAGMIRDADGNFYGTTSSGGTSGWGTVFRIDVSGNENVIYNFAGQTAGDGASPQLARLARDANGNLYGTTVWGGNDCAPGFFGCGVVFKMDGTGNETLLYKFTGGADGGVPYGGVAIFHGNVYGTTYYGGSGTCSNPNGCGVVFKIDSAGNETVLHNFTSDGSDGYLPAGGLTVDSSGNLYGTTTSGGANGGTCGTIFKLSPSGTETILHSFTCSDGSLPYNLLFRNTAGDLYGVTPYGGSFNCGVVFKLTAAGTYSVLHTFTCGHDGANPFTDVLVDSRGDVYGTTYQGGRPECGGNGVGCGVVFKITP